MSVSVKQIMAWDCNCNVCGYEWLSIAARLPACCPNKKCRSRGWNGKKIQQRPAPKAVIELPKPVKVRTINED